MEGQAAVGRSPETEHTVRSTKPLLQLLKALPVSSVQERGRRWPPALRTRSRILSASCRLGCSVGLGQLRGSTLSCHSPHRVALVAFARARREIDASPQHGYRDHDAHETPLPAALSLLASALLSLLKTESFGHG